MCLLERTVLDRLFSKLPDEHSDSAGVGSHFLYEGVVILPLRVQTNLRKQNRGSALRRQQHSERPGLIKHSRTHTNLTL